MGNTSWRNLLRAMGRGRGQPWLALLCIPHCMPPLLYSLHAVFPR